MKAVMQDMQERNVEGYDLKAVGLTSALWYILVQRASVMFELYVTYFRIDVSTEYSARIIK